MSQEDVMSQIKIGRKMIGDSLATYFIADIAANHDGDLNRAKKLIYLAKECGADAVKFQNFQASKIVSDYGFKKLGSQQAHQSTWKKSVFNVYQDHSISWEWTPILKEECDKIGIDYFSSPYDFESVDHLYPYVDVYKIGSGEITWLEMLRYIAKKDKPVLLATGAATLVDVRLAVDVILKINPKLVLMQCNTNYTASSENYKYLNLNVLKNFHSLYPNLVLGLSDHTHGFAAVLGAITLGARVVEKHFTDENNREGPDHRFAMNPTAWRKMVDQTRLLELALGDGVKGIEENEKESIVVQQRCLRAAHRLLAGQILKREDIDILRPASNDGINPQNLESVVGRKLISDIVQGDAIKWTDIRG